MARYRKRPVEIEAVQLTLDNMSEVAEWCGGKVYSRPPMRAITGLSIQTLEGEMAANFGDYIIRGIAGEFYPCRKDIFEDSYEPV